VLRKEMLPPVAMETRLRAVLELQERGPQREELPRSHKAIQEEGLQISTEHTQVPRDKVTSEHICLGPSLLFGQQRAQTLLIQLRSPPPSCQPRPAEERILALK